MNFLLKLYVIIVGISGSYMAMEMPLYSKNNLHPVQKYSARILAWEDARNERYSLNNLPSRQMESDYEIESFSYERDCFLENRIQSLQSDVQNFTSQQPFDVQKALMSLSAAAIKYNKAKETGSNSEIQETKELFFRWTYNAQQCYNAAHFLK